MKGGSEHEKSKHSGDILDFLSSFLLSFLLGFLFSFLLSFLLCDGILVKGISVLHPKGQGGVGVGKFVSTTTNTSEFGDVRGVLVLRSICVPECQ